MDGQCMSATYINKFRDAIYFSLYHQSRSPMMLAVAAVFLLWTIFSVWRTLPRGASFFVFALVMLVYTLLLLGIMFLFMLLIALWAGSTRKNKRFLTRHNVTLLDGAFVEESEYGRTECRWRGIQKLCRTNNYIIAYLNHNTAHLIPRRAFGTREEWDAFYGYMAEHCEVYHT